MSRLNRFSFVGILLVFFNVLPTCANDGKRYFVMNWYKQAIESFAVGTDEESQYGSGLSYLKLGLLYKEMCDSLVALNIHYYELLLAREQHLKVVYEEAKNLNTSKYPEYDIKYAKYNSKYVRYYLGITYCQNGGYEKSEKMLRQFLQDATARNEVERRSGLSEYKDYALIALGESLYLQGKKDEAQNTWNSISATNFNNPYIASELATTYVRLDYNIAEAEKIYAQITNVKPNTQNEFDLKRLHRNIAYICLSQNKLNDAKGHFDKLCLFKPCFVEKLDKIQRGELVLDIEVEFFDPIIFNHFSKFYLANALEKFKVLKSHPKYRLDALYGEVLCLYQLGHYNTVVSRLDELTGDDEVGGFAKILLGACLYKLGKKADATGEWVAVKNRYKNSPTLMVELAHTYAECGVELEEAARMCNQTLKTILRNPKKVNLTEYPPMNAFPKEDIYRRMGKTFFVAGKIDDAINAYEIVYDAVHKGVVGMRRRGNAPILMLNLAFAYYKRGFNTYKEPTGTYSIMQQFYPEVYPLHTAMQGIFAIEGNLHGIRGED